VSEMPAGWHTFRPREDTPFVQVSGEQCFLNYVFSSGVDFYFIFINFLFLSKMLNVV